MPAVGKLNSASDRKSKSILHFHSLEHRQLAGIGGRQNRRATAGREEVPAGKVEGKRQADGLVVLDFGEALLDLFGGDEVQTALLIC